MVTDCFYVALVVMVLRLHVSAWCFSMHVSTCFSVMSACFSMMSALIGVLNVFTRCYLKLEYCRY